MSNPFKTFEFYDSSSRNLRKQTDIDHKSYKILSLLGPGCPWTIIVPRFDARTRNFGPGRIIHSTAMDNLGMHDVHLIRTAILSSVSSAISILESSELEVLKLYQY